MDSRHCSSGRRERWRPKRRRKGHEFVARDALAEHAVNDAAKRAGYPGRERMRAEACLHVGHEQSPIVAATDF